MAVVSMKQLLEAGVGIYRLLHAGLPGGEVGELLLQAVVQGRQGEAGLDERDPGREGALPQGRLPGAGDDRGSLLGDGA